MSKTNNNFIPLEFDKAKRTIVIDSIYSAAFDKYKNSANKEVAKIMEEQKKSGRAKSLGNYEEYLAILNSNQMYLETSAALALDKIECLFILNRREEAIKFAKQVWSKGKLLKPDSRESSNVYIEISNAYYYAIQNIAKGDCD